MRSKGSYLRVSGWLSGFLVFSDNSSLNERGAGMLWAPCKWGCCQASPAARLQPDGLTGQSPLLVNNATLHSGQLPIRKTAEAQRGGRTQHVTDTALPAVRDPRRPVFPESLGTERRKFFLFDVFQGRLSISKAEDTGAAFPRKLESYSYLPHVSATNTSASRSKPRPSIPYALL